MKPNRTSVWAQYSVLSENRDGILARLNSNGIPAAIYYPKPLHLQEAFRFLEYTRGDFPISEEVSNQIFCLPMHPYLNAETQSHITEVLRQ